LLNTRLDYRRSPTDTVHDIRHAYDPRYGVWVQKELVSRTNETLLWRSRFEPDPDRSYGGPMINFEDEAPAAAAAEAARNALDPESRVERLSENGRTSFSLKISKAVVSFLRHSEEEAMMLAEARHRHAHDPRPAPEDITVTKRERSWGPGVTMTGPAFDPTPYESEIRALVQDMPYLRSVVAGRPERRALFSSRDGKAWTFETYHLSDRIAQVAYRARIAQAFGLSQYDNWATTKAAIRRLLLPRANQLLQLASVRRLLDEALADGRRALVIGPWVFWYEPDGGLGWTVKQIGNAKGQAGLGDEVIWEEGTILSKNHGRIVVLPYRKTGGERVAGYTRNVSGDGPAKPRHPSQYVEIPFQRLDRDLMIGLLGELPYE